MGNIENPAPLRVTGLSKRFGNTEVLRQLNLDVAPGAIHGLVGLNGSGKTTTLECILGMLPYQAGDVSVLGFKPSQLWQARGQVVGIFDTAGLNPALTVRQTLEHARILCPDPRRSPAEVESLLGVSRYSNYRIRQLSLGNRRRASIAHALIGQPAFIVLDEPFNGLDAGGVDELLALITRLNKTLGTAFLLSSHQLPYLEHICSHIAILHQGQIAVSEQIETLLSGLQAHLLIRCDQPDKAMALLNDTGDDTRVKQMEDGLLALTLSGQNPAEINQRLVRADILVSELRTRQATLATLFQQITSGTQDDQNTLNMFHEQDAQLSDRSPL